MKKLTKIVAATGITFSTLLASGVGISQEAQAQEEEAVTPWYEYNGYVENNASFVVDPDFVRAAKYNNITFNGYKVNLQDAESDGNIVSKQVYDQDFAFVDEDNRPDKTTFRVAPGQLTKEDIINAYGEDYEFHPDNPGPGGEISKDNGDYAYNFNGNQIKFAVLDG
ncbi:hypothetical protein K0017_08975 [Staphylococcus massiliensis]|nr:hypothetical protein [Staphylococcus massiliensis]MCG3402444.1 hypothetical protein [Staphylococcus massiliensis]